MLVWDENVSLRRELQFGRKTLVQFETKSLRQFWTKILVQFGTKTLVQFGTKRLVQLEMKNLVQYGTKTLFQFGLGHKIQFSLGQNFSLVFPNRIIECFTYIESLATMIPSRLSSLHGVLLLSSLNTAVSFCNMFFHLGVSCFSIDQFTFPQAMPRQCPHSRLFTNSLPLSQCKMYGRPNTLNTRSFDT